MIKRLLFVYLFIFCSEGKREEIKINESDIPLIPLPVAGLSASQYWKEGVEKDENEGWFKGESEHRAQGGLVPTERAQWVAETEACWIYKQSIYPARDPERLASAIVIYTDTQPSFTLYYRYPPTLSLHPFIPSGLCLSVGPDAQLASSYDIWS